MSSVPDVTPELRAIWAMELARREEPTTQMLINELKRSDDWRVVKVAEQYEKGIVSFGEFEMKIRELFTR